MQADEPRKESGDEQKQEKKQNNLPATVPTNPPATAPINPIVIQQEEAKKLQNLFLGGQKQQKSDAEVVLEMMNQILSKDNIEQKSRQIFENIAGICRSYVMIESLIEGSCFTQVPDRDGFTFIEPSRVRFLPEIMELIGKEECVKDHGLMSSLKILCDQMTTRLVSLNGLGREELIKLASAFNFTLTQQQHEKNLADQILGIRGQQRR